MGSTSQHRPKGTSNAEFFLDLHEPGTVFHAHGTVDNVFYAAVERPSSPGEVTALIVQTWWSPTSFFNFTYKDMSESMGPVQTSAPEKVLAALTPTENLTALEWREEVRQRHAQRKAMRGLRDGDRVRLAYPLSFTDGAKIDTFTIRRDQCAQRTAGATRRTKVSLVHEWSTYRLPDWQDRVVEIIRDGESIATPLGQMQPENRYVAKVERLSWSRDPQVAALLKERYNAGPYDPLAILARREFRAGEPWEGLDAALALAEQETQRSA